MTTLTTQAHDSRRLLALWLLLCCTTVFAMVVLGGVTRLTGSGLSMVEWEPIIGVLPPLSEAQWEEAFAQYREYPEYRLKNAGMDLQGFQSIFWLEYWHRVLGRLIGVIFAVPFVIFLLRGMIDRPLIPKLAGLFVLGGLQGLMGWYMVKSGLVDDPHVSQYRLTAHLLLAFLIFAGMFWVALDLLRGGPAEQHSRHSGTGTVLWLTGFVLLTIASGGFVAGLKAGFTFNTFPLMNGQWIPDGIALLEPGWRNLFENITTVQFNHRVLAVSLGLALIGYSVKLLRGHPLTQVRTAVWLLLIAVVVQLTLGISTLLLVVPIPLAAAHQGGAVLLFAAILNLAHQLRRV
ncbi:MAG: COX15/CtaA family protein [Pseudomonadales bacterium]|nr:COX15/CtaA family protein [Pseudomonadales bacterium]